MWQGMKPADGSSHSQRHIIGIRLCFHKIGDQNPVFHVCIPNAGSNARLSRSLHAGELVRGIADDLRAQDFQEVGIFSYDNFKGKG